MSLTIAPDVSSDVAAKSTESGAGAAGVRLRIRHSGDKPWVIQLKDELQKHVLKVWFDQDEIRPGDLFVTQ